MYIDRAVFNACIVTIEDWLNIKGMVAHLMTYGLASRARQIERITDITELMKHVDTCGRHGYFLLYVCLYKSQESNLGHQDACGELEKKGTYIWKHVLYLQCICRYRHCDVSVIMQAAPCKNCTLT